MKIFYALSIILFASVSVKSQERSSSSAQEASTRIIKFYPNPAITSITFDLQRSLDKSYTLQIFNFLGKKVYELNNVNARTMVNLTDFYRGVYIFQLRDKGGKIVDSGKFQVSK